MGRSIAFVGSGAMATAIAGGLHKLDLFDKFYFSDRNENALTKMKTLIPDSITSTDNCICAKADVIVLAVKPQFCKPVLKEIGPSLTPGHLVLSIMAGVTMGQIRKETESKCRIVRTMPNIPLLALLGTVAFCVDPSATKEDADLVLKMFNSIGYCVEIQENQMDLIPGVSGSSPAFVALFIDALADGGVQCGLPRPLALRLAANAVYGAGGLIAKGFIDHPCLLRDAVCSPGGSSIVGVTALERGAFRASVINAVIATTERTRELSKI
eukprot:Tbor_TRINITY_DN3011_c0_g1::TRINITY_DN3011_c0_g1_i1::g.17409::m.17409/K00286/proC; pyrroline-5-carboxylate reductase